MKIKPRINCLHQNQETKAPNNFSEEIHEFPGCSNVQSPSEMLFTFYIPFVSSGNIQSHILLHVTYTNAKIIVFYYLLFLGTWTHFPLAFQKNIYIFLNKPQPSCITYTVVYPRNQGPSVCMLVKFFEKLWRKQK